jgi:sphingomyelin phosphodiesterase
LPIARQDSITYRNAIGSDKLASKGAVYAKFAIAPSEGGKDTFLHVFMTHTQAWDDVPSVGVRMRQFDELRSWIDSFKIPADEAVVVSGDLNCDFWNDEMYAAMMRRIRAVNFDELNQKAHPPVDADGAVSPTHVCSCGSGLGGVRANEWVALGSASSDGTSAPPKHLDYILFLEGHVQPTSAVVGTVFDCKCADDDGFEYKKRRFRELSDHYPVLGRFRLPLAMST